MSEYDIPKNKYEPVLTQANQTLQTIQFSSVQSFSGV